MIEIIFGIMIGAFAYGVWGNTSNRDKQNIQIKELDERVGALEAEVGILISTPKD